MRRVTPQPSFGHDLSASLLDRFREYSVALNQCADHRLSEFVQVVANYTAGQNDHVIECAPSGAMTVTLPAASVMRNKRIVIKRTNNTTHTVTIQSSSGNIDGAASVTLTTAHQSREVFSDGANWWLLDVGAVANVCDEGPTWAEATVLSRTHKSIAVLNGLIVIGDVVSSNAGSQWSDDYGATWNAGATTVSSSGYGMRLAAGNGVFYADINAVQGAYSTDGSNWTGVSHTSVVSSTPPVFGFDEFYVFAGTGTNYYKTPDGTSFTYGSVPSYAGANGGAFGNGIMVTVGSNGATNLASYSTDGSTFTAATTPPAFTPGRVAFGAGVFVCMPYATVGATTSYAYTTDGITWTAGTLPQSRKWVEVIYAQGVFLACGAGDSNTDELATSTDGINWTMVASPQYFTDAAGFSRMVYADNGKYFAINLTTSTLANSGDC